MNLANKTFRDLKTNELVKVIDSFDNIAIIEGGSKMDVRNLLDTNLYTEYIDPSNFFDTQRAYDSLFDKIKNIDTSKIKDDPQDLISKIGGNITPAFNESAIIISSEEDERAELARKYGASIDIQSSVQKQNETFARILGEDADELPKTTVVINNQTQVKSSKEYIPPVQRIDISDPITTMFKNVKRGVDFKMNIEISNKIPRIDFIEMMEDSYEISIIDFLAEEFTNNLLNNPEQIKQMIRDRIKQVVYGGELKIEKKGKVEINVQNTESKLKVKPRTTRKTTNKKESKND
jgi:hypothetical protein